MHTFLRMVFLILFVTQICFAQWEKLNEGFKGRINTIDFVNENIGWIASSNGTLLKTTDGGENWTTILDNGFEIKQIDFINDSVGWILGGMYTSSSYGIILKTINGGFDWSVQKQFPDTQPNSIFAIDEKNVFAVFSGHYSENSLYMWKTNNGGDEWTNVSPNLTDRYCHLIWFMDPDNGIIVGDRISSTGSNKKITLRTTDGGHNWYESDLSDFNVIEDLQFIDSTGFFIAGFDTTYFLYKTEDMFQSWSKIYNYPHPIKSIYFLDKKNAYAIIDSTKLYTGGRLTSTSLPYYNNYIANVIKSSDGGNTWEKVQSINCFPLKKIFFNSERTGFIISDFALIKTVKGEDNWEIQKLSYPLNNIYFVDKDKGILSGSVILGHWGMGNLFSSKNVGETWDIKLGLFDYFKSFDFVNDKEGFYLTYNSICKTSDGGISWNQIFQINPYSDSYYFFWEDICFMDANFGWAVGNYWANDTSGAGILGTLDGGDNWNLIWKYPHSNSIGENLYSITAADTTAWAVGESGMIVKYTPKSGWQKQITITDLPLKKVFFIDDEHGWIAGGYKNENNIKSILLKTTNGGENWNENKLDFLINDLWFVTNQHGWAVGCDTTNKGVILETTDGGDNWTVAVDNLIGPLNSIFIKENYAWAVGEYGLILRTTDAGVTWVDDNNEKVYPTEFQLEQNYPNPFNPSTTIKYSVPSSLMLNSFQHLDNTEIPKQAMTAGRQVRDDAAHVTLKVYDILGREVTTLVNKNQKPGNYEVEWNISDKPSGIYFYKIIAGDFVQVKKMILLK